MEIEYNIDEHYEPIIKEIHHGKTASLLYKIDDWAICIDMEDSGYLSTSLLNMSTKQIITTNSRLIPFLGETYLFIEISFDSWMNYTFKLNQMRN